MTRTPLGVLTGAPGPTTAPVEEKGSAVAGVSPRRGADGDLCDRCDGNRAECGHDQIIK